MPELSSFQRDHDDVREMFHIFGVHEYVEGDLARVRRKALSVAGDIGKSASLLPFLLLDEELGMFQSYRPEGLGDMVLLDPQGDVAAVGKGALTRLDRELASARKALRDAVSTLRAAKGEDAVDGAIRGLYELGVRAAVDAVAEHVGGCSKNVLGAVLASVLRHGGTHGEGLLVGEAGLRSSESKRREVAFDVVEAHPQPAYAGALLELAAVPKSKSAVIGRALTAATACDPRGAAVERALLDHSRAKNTKVRRVVAGCLGTVGSADAKARLVEMLTKDRAASVRRHAVGGLARIGGDDVVAALRKAAQEDKASTVREAAAKALAEVDGK